MLFRVPFDDLTDIFKNHNKVYCWLVNEDTVTRSKNDVNCQYIESILTKSICVRICMTGNEELLKIYKFDGPDTCYLMQNGKIIWTSHNPPKDIITQKMHETTESKIENLNIYLKLHLEQ